MNQKLKRDELLLTGKWIDRDGSIIADETCNRIEWLVGTQLELIKVNGNTWTAFYKNPEDESYWELSYPQSHLHGGGPPMLQKTTKEAIEQSR